MLGHPTMADETQIRSAAAFRTPRYLPRDDADDSNADDEP